MYFDDHGERRSVIGRKAATFAWAQSKD